MKEESEKFSLKLNIQKTKIMASGPITSWQIDGENMETVIGFISGGSEIAAEGNCNHEIKRCLLLGKKAMTNLAEAPVLWPPHAKSWLTGKDFDAGRDWGQEEKGMTEDEMAGWHHWLDGSDSE